MHCKSWTLAAGLQQAKSSGRAAYLCVNPPNTGMDEPNRLPYNITNRKNG
jgi:hypothetical protein